MNYYSIIPLIIAAIALIIFLVKKNYQDEKEYESDSNEEYPNKIDEQEN